VSNVSMPDFENMVAWSFRPDNRVAFEPPTEHMQVDGQLYPVKWDAGWVEADYLGGRSDRHYVVRATVQVDRFPVSAMGVTFAEARTRLQAIADRTAKLVATLAALTVIQ